MTQFLLRTAVYLVCFVMAWYAMSGVNFEKFLKPGHIGQAWMLYLFCVCALAYLAGSFLLAFVYLK